MFLPVAGYRNLPARLPGTTPFSGEEGKTNRSARCAWKRSPQGGSAADGLTGLLRAHPYEEVAYDLIPLANPRLDDRPRPGRPADRATTLAEFAARVKAALGTASLRVVGAPGRQCEKGRRLRRQRRLPDRGGPKPGADVLVTGDVKYHEARRAESRGLALIDAGHFATERLMVQGLAQALREEARNRALDFEFIEWEGEEDPF